MTKQHCKHWAGDPCNSGCLVSEPYVCPYCEIDRQFEEIERLQSECIRLLARGDKAELELQSLKTHYARACAVEPEGQLTIVKDVTTVSPNFKVTATLSEPIAGFAGLPFIVHIDAKMPPNQVEFRNGVGQVVKVVNIDWSPKKSGADGA